MSALWVVGPALNLRAYDFVSQEIRAALLWVWSTGIKLFRIRKGLAISFWSDEFGP